MLKLSTSGSKDRLIERHRQWVNLYNANLDAAPTRRESFAQLRRHLQSWERGLDDAFAPVKNRPPANDKQYQTWLARARCGVLADPQNHHKGQYDQLTSMARSSLPKRQSETAERAEQTPSP